MTIAAGTRLGPYEIRSSLGVGGMGAVYLAYDAKLQRTVAIKVLSDEVSEETGRERLLHEARAASGLNHPHVCVVHEVGESQGRPFIVMEYVEGKALSQLIPHDGFSAEMVIRYGIQIADALAHAHERGVIHRDLKSANVIVTKDGRAKVVDFGLAQRVAHASPDVATASKMPLSHAGNLAGTISYMAPEVLRGELPTTASDIWGLGVLMYEMCGGRLPFTGRTPFDLTAAILRGPAPPLPAHIPPSIRTVITGCLAKEPAERYRTAGEVRAALRAVESDVVPLPLLPAARMRRRITRWGMAAALVLVLLGAAVFLLKSRNGTSNDSSRVVAAWFS